MVPSSYGTTLLLSKKKSQQLCVKLIALMFIYLYLDLLVLTCV